jgi:hypothetical protein
MVSDFNAVNLKNVMRCPVCQWVSVTKIIDTVLYIGLSMEPMGDHFVCTNPACKVERIYGENGVVLVKGLEKKEA